MQEGQITTKYLQNYTNNGIIELSKELINEMQSTKSFVPYIRKNHKFVSLAFAGTEKDLVKLHNNSYINTEEVTKSINNYLIKDVVDLVVEYFNEYYLNSSSDTLVFSPSGNSYFPRLCDIIYDIEFDGDLFVSNSCTDKRVKVTREMIIPLVQNTNSSIFFYGCDFKYKPLFLNTNLQKKYMTTSSYHSLGQSLLVTFGGIIEITYDKERIEELMKIINKI